MKDTKHLLLLWWLDRRSSAASDQIALHSGGTRGCKPAEHQHKGQEDSIINSACRPWRGQGPCAHQTASGGEEGGGHVPFGL